MIPLRYQTIFLLVFLIAFFTINGLCHIENETLCLNPSAYMTTGLVVVSILAIPLFSRYPVSISIIVGMMAYLLSLLFFSYDALIGGTYTYLRIVEVGMLLLGIALAHSLASHWQEVEQLVYKMALKNVDYKANPLEQAANDIRLELIRGRQHERPLSVIVVEVNSEESSKVLLGQALEKVQQAIANRLQMVSLVRLIGKQAQRTDLILEDKARNRLLILCPETDEATSSSLAQHIGHAAVNQLGVPVSCGRATFPADALTFDELVRHAESYISHNKKEHKIKEQD